MGLMAASEGSRSAGSKLAIRIAVLGVVAGLGAIAHGVLGVGDSSEPSAAPSDATSSSAPSVPGSSQEPDADPDKDTDSDTDTGPGGQDDSGKVPDGGVPSGVTGGIGDDVAIHRLQVLTTRTSAVSLPGSDLAGVTMAPATRSDDLVAWARSRGMEAHAAVAAGDAGHQDIIVWRADRFSLMASGDEYGTRSLRTTAGLEARRILWVTLRHRASGAPVSYVLARLETGNGSATRAANEAYRERVDELRARLSLTSTVIVGIEAGDRHLVTVPDGNVHPGVVLAPRERRSVPDGTLASLSLQAPTTTR